nr:ribonuclease H-like domain-containing protein [Tanacetum cinerariifolium]
MELESTQSSTTAKLPLLKQGDYEMWRLQIEQYFQIQDYALWNVIENGNSFKPVAEITTDDASTSTTIISGHVTIEEKAKKKNDVKARNLDTMSLDDLNKNFKFVEHEVKGTTSTNTNSKNMAFVSSPSPNSTSDATVYAFLANQPNRSQLVHEDLEQIHKDDLEETNLKWQLALLSMKAKIFFQKTGKKITINGSDIAGYEKSKVECFNCHKMGHFAREYTSSKAMVEIDGAGFDWSYMADDEAPTNMAFMDLSDLESGLGYVSYNVVPPLHTERFSPLRIDLSYTRLPEFAEPSVKSYGVMPIEVVTHTSSVKISAPVKENFGAPLIEEWESDEEDEVKSPPKKERKNVEPSVNKVEVEIPKQNDKPTRRPVKYAEMYKTQRPRGNQRNWNNLKSHQLGGKITSKGTIKTGKLDFEDVYFVKDETSRTLKSVITNIENLVDKKVKVIRCDNGTKFNNRVMNEFCVEKGIKREYSIARTPQQNEVAERRNRTLIEATRKMLADSKLPITFLGKAVNTACYVQNRILVVKPHFKTPYELFRGRTHAFSFMRPFGCHVTILNTLDHLGKFNDKSDEGFFVGYSTNSKPLEYTILEIGRLSDDYFGDNNDMRSLHEVELDISNLSITYLVPTTPNTRISKDHSLDNVIGDMQYGGFEDPDYPNKVYKVEKALYGLHQALRAWLQVKQKSDEIFISQDKYVDEILRKFKYEDVKPGSTLTDKEKALLKDSDDDDVDVHLYSARSKLWLPLPLLRLNMWQLLVVAVKYSGFRTNCWIMGEVHHIWLSLILDKKMIKYELSN